MPSMPCRPFVRLIDLDRLVPAFIVVLALSLAPLALAASPVDRPSQPALQEAAAKDDAWFKSDAGRAFLDHVVSWQNANGGWWKAYDPRVPRPAHIAPPAAHIGAPNDQTSQWMRTSTFDNGATTTEMRLLARGHRLTSDPSYARAFERGLTFIFDSQYPHGGWPQRFPLEDNYGRHVTFNDRLTVNVMELLRDVADGKPGYDFVPADERKRAREAFGRGIEAILKCQYRDKSGKLAAWGQQHDEVTFAPTHARSYELPSLTASESSDITLLLMSLPDPDARVREAVEASVAWFEATKIPGKRYDKKLDANGRLSDRVLSDDPAGVLWARFYELDTNKPFFCNRDGVKTDVYANVLQERRAGYMWFGPWGTRVIEAYPKWKARTGSPQASGR